MREQLPSTTPPERLVCGLYLDMPEGPLVFVSDPQHEGPVKQTTTAGLRVLRSNSSVEVTASHVGLPLIGFRALLGASAKDDLILRLTTSEQEPESANKALTAAGPVIRALESIEPWHAHSVEIVPLLRKANLSTDDLLCGWPLVPRVEPRD